MLWALNERLLELPLFWTRKWVRTQILIEINFTSSTAFWNVKIKNTMQSIPEHYSTYKLNVWNSSYNVHCYALCTWQADNFLNRSPMLWALNELLLELPTLWARTWFWNQMLIELHFIDVIDHFWNADIKTTMRLSPEECCHLIHH